MVGIPPDVASRVHASSRPHELEAIVQAAAGVVQSGVLSPSGHGNLSMRLDGDRMLLTSSGISALTAQRLAVVTFEGSVVEGQLSESASEIVPMHAVVYRCRPEVGAIVHTHSPHLTSFALAHRPIPCRYEALLRQGQGVDVPVVAWAPRGSQASTAGIADRVKQVPDTWAVLLANHGPLVFGPSPTKAASLLVALEEAARLELLAAAIGGAESLPAGALGEVRSSMAKGQARTGH